MGELGVAGAWDVELSRTESGPKGVVFCLAGTLV